MGRWKCQLSILTLVRRTHALIIGNSQSSEEVHKESSTPIHSSSGDLSLCEPPHLLSVTLNLVRRFTKRQVPRGGVYGGLVILPHPRLMVRECSLIFDSSEE